MNVIKLSKPEVHALDWTESYPPPEKPYDMILLTDCIFSVYLIQPLISQILNNCGKKSEIYCCHEIRDEVKSKYIIIIIFFLNKS